jgi:hypothetical protein
MSEWLEENLSIESTCQQLRNLIEHYHKVALPLYSSNPEAFSIMLLTISELWIACDKSATYILADITYLGIWEAAVNCLVDYSFNHGAAQTKAAKLLAANILQNRNKVAREVDNEHSWNLYCHLSELGLVRVIRKHWAYAFAILGTICAIITIPLYLSTSTIWSAFLSFSAAIVRAFMV